MSKKPGPPASDTKAGGMPPGLALYRMSIGHYVSRALDLVARLGIADLLEDGPCDVEELARRSKTHAAALNRVLRLLVSVGVFDQLEDGRFALTPMGDLLRENAPGSMRASIRVFAGIGIQDSWKELEYCVRTGEPAFRRTNPNANPFTEMNEDPEQVATFDRAMATFTIQTAAAVAAAYDFSACKTIADVGGGNGALLTGILGANPGLRGVVFDQPHVVERAQEALEAAGLADRCSVVGGSFFESVPAGADAYLLKHVIHDWNDEDAVKILSNCRAVVPAKGKLLIIEGVYPARVDQSLDSRGAAANDVNMLVVSGGRQRSETEFRNVLDRSGFRLSRIVRCMAPVSVIEGEPV